MAEITIKKTIEITVDQFLNACDIPELTKIRSEIDSRISEKELRFKANYEKWIRSIK
jgi:hypothetical protein